MPPGYTLRPLAPADEPFLWQMLHLAIFLPPGSPPLPPDIVRQPELSRYVAGWGRTDDCGFVATAAQAERPCGAAWLRLLTGNQAGYGYVDEMTPELTIAVLPDHRRLGLGGSLLERLLSHAHTRFDAVSLSVSRANPALRLYQRFGFVAVDSDDDSLTMVLRWR